MQPIFQTKRGRGGNCLQAALASLLHLSLDAVQAGHDRIQKIWEKFEGN